MTQTRAPVGKAKPPDAKKVSARDTKDGLVLQPKRSGGGR